MPRPVPVPDERAQRIDAALARHGLAQHLRIRIEHLLDGREDRGRLHCCGSNCIVCVRVLQAVLAEVEAPPSAADGQPC